jgi:hypothetical protein
MQLNDYVQQVRDQLHAAAALGDERVREVADALAAAASPAVRLAIMAALAEAADEITAALLNTPSAPTIAMRLDADEIRVDVTSEPAEPPAIARNDDGDASARISMRLSDALKSDIDIAATKAGVSVNTWLVRAATAALSSAATPPWDRGSRNMQHVTGWING